MVRKEEDEENIYDHFDDDQADILQLHQQPIRRVIEPEQTSPEEDELSRIFKSIGPNYLDRDDNPREKFGLKEEPSEALEEEGPRNARSSPAAILGSKRIGSVDLPPELVEGVQNAISGQYHFLFMLKGLMVRGRSPLCPTAVSKTARAVQTQAGGQEDTKADRAGNGCRDGHGLSARRVCSSEECAGGDGEEVRQGLA